jgi:hypothetical protein
MSIGWQWVVIAMSLGAIVGFGLAWWQTSRELRKLEEGNNQ